MISEIRERTASRLWKRLASLPSQQQKQQLDDLLQTSECGRTSRFDQLRKGPVTISSVSFNVAVKRFMDLKVYGIQKLDFSGIPPIRLKNLARHSGMISVYKIARMSEEKRLAILVAFVKFYEVMALDDAIDILDMLITNIAGAAKRIGKKKRLRTLKDLDRSALRLASVCALILNESTEDNELRKTIYENFSKKSLEQSIDMINTIARPSSDDFHDEMIEQYGKVSRLMPTLLNQYFGQFSIR